MAVFICSLFVLNEKRRDTCIWGQVLPTSSSDMLWYRNEFHNQDVVDFASSSSSKSHGVESPYNRMQYMNQTFCYTVEKLLSTISLLFGWKYYTDCELKPLITCTWSCVPVVMFTWALSTSWFRLQWPAMKVDIQTLWFSNDSNQQCTLYDLIHLRSLTFCLINQLSHFCTWITLSTCWWLSGAAGGGWTDCKGIG